MAIITEVYTMLGENNYWLSVPSGKMTKSRKESVEPFFQILMNVSEQNLLNFRIWKCAVQHHS